MSRRASSTTSSATDSRSSPSTAPLPLRRGRIPAGIVVLAALGVALVALPLLGLSGGPRGPASGVSSSETALRPRISLIVATRQPRSPSSSSTRSRGSWCGAPSRQDTRACGRRPPTRDASCGCRRGSARGVRTAERDLLDRGCTSGSASSSPSRRVRRCSRRRSFRSRSPCSLSKAGLRGLDERLEGAAARSARPAGHVLRRVTLPLMAPRRRRARLSWARALGEFGATITFAGNLQGRT